MPEWSLDEKASAEQARDDLVAYLRPSLGDDYVACYSKGRADSVKRALVNAVAEMDG